MAPLVCFGVCGGKEIKGSLMGQSSIEKEEGGENMTLHFH